MELRSDAGHSWTLQYRLAFASICGDQVVQLMGEYLEDNDFGFDAACVLKTAWDREQKMSKPDLFKRWPDLSSVKARRVERHAQIAPRPTSPIAEMIFSAIERLVQQGGDNRERLAIMLGRIALSIPHGDKTAVVNALLALPQPIRMKRELLAALILDGEIISADVVLEGVHAWLADAREHTWRFHEGLWEVEGWLELLPFTDRPAAATIEGVELVNRALPRPHRMERVVWALGNAPDEEVGPVLAELVRRHPQLASQHEWIKAIVARDTVAAGIILVDLVLDGSLTTGPGAADRWWISEQLAALTRVHPELRAMLLRRYGDGISNDAAQQVIERVLSEIGDAECVLALVRGYARNAKRFDGLIHAALENVALDKRPATGWVGAYELHPVPISALRKEFFRMLEGTPHEAALGAACLIAIDELRDEYGPAEFESRHPDVESGRPWPLAATS
jgi:hypothetical protein